MPAVERPLQPTTTRQSARRRLPSRAPSPPTPGLNPVHARLLEFQRLAGNRATAAALNVTVQRHGPDPPTGLAIDQTLEGIAQATTVHAMQLSTNRFHGGATIPGHIARPRLAALMDLLNTEFRSAPVKRVPLKFGGPRWGSFSKPKWQMKVGLDADETITVNDFKEFAITLVHEARHAEQAFLEARAIAEAHPDLTADQLRQHGAGDLNQEALELAVIVAGTVRLNPQQKSLVTWLDQPVGKAGADEARQILIEYLRRNKLDVPGGRELDDLLASQTPKDWKTLKVNSDLDEAKVEARKLRELIVAYNKTKPSDVYPVVEQPEDDDFRTLHAAYVRFGTNRNDNAFQAAWRTYLSTRRFKVIDRLRQAFVAYASENPAESDAHSVETKLRTKLGMPRGDITIEIPNPKRW